MLTLARPMGLGSPLARPSGRSIAIIQVRNTLGSFIELANFFLALPRIPKLVIIRLQAFSGGTEPEE